MNIEIFKRAYNNGLKGIIRTALLYQVITKFMQNIKIFVQIYDWNVTPNSNKSKIFSFER